MTVYTPRHDNVSGHQAQTASDDLARHQRAVQKAEAQHKASPVPGTVASSWVAPPEYGRLIDRTPTRVNGVPCEALWFSKHRVPVIRRTIKLHGIDA